MKAIKKVAETPLDEKTGLIFNGTNIDDKTINTYSANVIDGLVKDVYSTEETVVGTWIDGKPIYRKILRGTLSTVGNITYLYIDDNLKEIVRVYSYYLTSGNQHVPIPYINSSKQRVTANSVDKSWAFINEIETNAELPCGAIIEYTKTTD